MSKRKAFNFLRSYYDVLEDIYDDKDKLTYLMAILDRQFKGIQPELTGIPRLSYRGQQHNIDKSVEGWESKTGEKLFIPTKDPTEDPTEGSYQHPSGDVVMTTEGPTQDPYLQEQEQEEEEEQEQEEVKKEVLDKKKFYAQNRSSIEFVRDLNNCSLDDAIDICFSTDIF
jgi:hypothetical protein